MPRHRVERHMDWYIKPVLQTEERTGDEADSD